MSSTIDKLTNLKQRAAEKADRLAGNKLADNRPERDGDKIFNSMSNPELLNMLSDVNNNDALYVDEDTNIKYQIDPITQEKKPYVGETDRLYMYGTDNDDVVKFGRMTGDLPVEARYDPSIVPNYGWEPGPKGVNTDKLFMNMLVPKAVGKSVESLIHGNEFNQQIRTVPYGGKTDELKEAYGSGYTEYLDSNKFLVDKYNNATTSDEKLTRDILKHITNVEPKAKDDKKYSEVNYMDDGAGASFGAYQLTRGSVRDYLELINATKNNPRVSNLIEQFDTNGNFIGDTDELNKVLKATGNTEYGREAQEKVAMTNHIQPGIDLAKELGITDPKAIMQLVDHYHNAGPGGVKDMLAMASGNTAEELAEARKKHYRTLNNYDKFGSGWENRVDNTLNASFSTDRIRLNDEPTSWRDNVPESFSSITEEDLAKKLRSLEYSSKRNVVKDVANIVEEKGGVYEKNEDLGSAVIFGALNLTKDFTGFVDDTVGVGGSAKEYLQTQVNKLNYDSPHTVENLRDMYGTFTKEPNGANLFGLITQGLNSGIYGIAESAVYMLSTVNPYTMTATILSMAHDFASGRNESLGIEENTAMDSIKALPFATLAMMMEKVGVKASVVKPFKEAVKKGNDTLAKKILEGIAAEYGTETAQSALELTYKTLETPKWQGLSETMLDAHWNGIVGGISGGMMSGTAGAVGKLGSLGKELKEPSPEDKERADLQGKVTPLNDTEVVTAIEEINTVFSSAEEFDKAKPKELWESLKSIKDSIDTIQDPVVKERATALITRVKEDQDAVRDLLTSKIEGKTILKEDVENVLFREGKPKIFGSEMYVEEILKDYTNPLSTEAIDNASRVLGDKDLSNEKIVHKAVSSIKNTIEKSSKNELEVGKELFADVVKYAKQLSEAKDSTTRAAAIANLDRVQKSQDTKQKAARALLDVVEKYSNLDPDKRDINTIAEMSNKIDMQGVKVSLGKTDKYGDQIKIEYPGSVGKPLSLYVNLNNTNDVNTLSPYKETVENIIGYTDTTISDIEAIKRAFAVAQPTPKSNIISDTDLDNKLKAQLEDLKNQLTKAQNEERPDQTLITNIQRKIRMLEKGSEDRKQFIKPDRDPIASNTSEQPTSKSNIKSDTDAKAHLKERKNSLKAHLSELNNKLTKAKNEETPNKKLIADLEAFIRVTEKEIQDSIQFIKPDGAPIDSLVNKLVKLSGLDKLVKTTGTTNKIMNREEVNDEVFNEYYRISGKLFGSIDDKDLANSTLTSKFSMLTDESKGAVNKLLQSGRVRKIVALNGVDYITTYQNTLLYNTDEDLVNIFGLDNASQLTNDHYEAMSEGNFLNNVADTIGGKILKDIGIKANKDIPEGVFRELQSALGTASVLILQDRGLLEITNVNTPSISVFSKAGNAAVYAVKITPEYRTTLESNPEGSKQKAKKYQAVLKEINPDGGFRKEELYTPADINRDIDVQGNPYGEVAGQSKKVIRKLDKQEFILDEGLLKYVEEYGIDEVKKALGYKATTDAKGNPIISPKDKKKQDGKNRDIDKTIDELYALRDRAKGNPFRFNWSFVKNGRFMLDSNTVNPQTDKFHRFLVGLTTNKVKVKNMDVFHIAIAQAFGYPIDKSRMQDSIAEGKRIAEMYKGKPSEALKALKDGKLEYEEFGHALQAVQALENYDSNGEFETNLTLEIDAVTSGIILQSLQSPLGKYAMGLIQKGGFITTDVNSLGVNELIATGQLDVYKTLADKVGDFIDADAIPKALKDYMPNAVEIDDKGNRTVTSAMRALFKPIVMVFGYGASIFSIKKKFAYTIIDELESKIIAGDKKAIALVKSYSSALNKLSDKELVNQVITPLHKKQSVLDYVVDRGYDGRRYTIRDNLTRDITKHYGDPIEKTLESIFPGKIKANELVNDAFNTMFKVFKDKYDAKLKELGKHEAQLTVDDKKTIVEGLTNVVPRVNTYFKNTNNSDGLIKLLNTARTTSSLEARVGFKKNGYLSTQMSKPNIRTFTDPGASGGVVPIHYIDGTIQSFAQLMVDALGVHDANVFNMDNAIEGNREYNKQAYEVSKSYNLYQNILDAFNETMKQTEMTKEMKELQADLEHLVNVVNNNREVLFSHDMVVDHATGLGATHKVKVVKKTDKKWIEYVSTPSSKKETSTVRGSEQSSKLADKARKIADNTSAKSEAFIELYDHLVDNKVELSESHDKHLKRLLEKFASKAKNFIPEMTVALSKKAANNSGIIDIDNKTIILSRRNRPQMSSLDMSLKEVYVHEIIHAVTEYADNSLVFNAKQRLKKLHRLAIKQLTVEDLMETDSPYDKDYERKLAEDRLAYITSNPSEFLAYGLTNEKVRAKLATINYYEKDQPVKFLDKLINLFESVLDFLLMNARSERGMKADALLEKLAFEIAESNNKALWQSNQNILARVLDKTLFKLDDKIADKLEEMEAKVGSTAEMAKSIRRSDSTFSALVSLGSFMFKSTVSSKYGDIARDMLSSLGFSPKGEIQRFLREFSDKTPVMEALEHFGRLSGNVDRERKSITNAIAEELSKTFSRKLSSKEQTSLGLGIIETDVEVLGDYDAIKEMVSSKGARDKEVDKVKKEILDLDSENGYYYINQSEGLGYYMATHQIVKANQQLNADNIAYMLGTDTINRDPKEGVEYLIDKLATLYSLDFTEQSVLDEVSNLMNTEVEGVTATLAYHRMIKKYAEQTIFKDSGEWINNVKGYTKDIHNMNKEVRVELVSKRNDMEKDGFKLVRVLTKDTNDGTKQQRGIYINDNYVGLSYDRYNFRLTQQKARGTTLRDAFINDNTDEPDYVEFAKSMQRMREEAKVELALQKKGIIPISAKRYLAPIMNHDGSVANYRYMMSKADKAHLLDRDPRVFQQLGVIQASIYDKQASKQHNRDLVDFAYEDWEANRGKEARKFIEIGPEAIDKEAREAWFLLPSDARHYATKKFGNKVMLREDVFHRYLGQREVSVINSKLLQERSIATRKFIRIGEYILKKIASNSKINIVIKLPIVLVTNILSNTGLLVNYQVDPINAFKLQIEGVRALELFAKEYKAVKRLKHRKMAGLNYDKAELARLEHSLDSNPVKDLIDDGLFQTIVEDIDLDEVKRKDFIDKGIEKVRGYIPKPVNTGLDYLFMTENTGMFKFLMRATQYSDFTARYALYTTLRKKGKSKEEARNAVIDPFINYDVPDNKTLSYLNGVGLVMFTRYFIRIQKVIQSGMLKKRPVSTILQIMLLNSSLDYDTPLESSPLSKDMTNLFYTPWDHVENLMTPKGYKLIDDYIIK